MPTVHGEVEFEFIPEDGPGDGQFRASGNVVDTLRRLLAQGDAAEAARLLGQCSDEIGDGLVEDVANASAATQENLVEMFVEARDFQRAAACAEGFGDDVRAGELYERAYLLDKAAAAFERAGEIERAAQARERALDFLGAAQLYGKAKRFLKAAQNLEKGGAYYEAGRLYLKLSKWSKAVEVLQKIRAIESHYLESTILLGRLFNSAGRPELATKRYRLAVGHRGLTEETLEVHYRLAENLAASGAQDEAVEIFDRILQVDPEYLDVEDRIKQLPAGEDELDDQSVVLDAVIVHPDPAESEIVGLAADIDFLKRVPLFQDLSKSELHEFLGHFKTSVYAPGATVIEQGDEGRSLCIVKRGRAKVVRAGEVGDDQVLNELGEGDFFGEMALVSDLPTSAWVMADGELSVLEIDRETFGKLLKTNDRFAARIYKVFLDRLIPRLVDAEARARRTT